MRSKAIRLCFVIGIVLFVSACSTAVNGQPEPHSSSESAIEAGRSLMASYGCGTCHTIPGVPGAYGTVGPRLDHFYEQMMIAGELPNTEENLIKWIEDPQKIIPGDAMPSMGVTEDQARDIAAYLYHQPTFGELISH